MGDQKMLVHTGCGCSHPNHSWRAGADELTAMSHCTLPAFQPLSNVACKMRMSLKDCHGAIHLTDADQSHDL